MTHRVVRIGGSTHLVPYFNAEAVNPNGSGISDKETRIEQEYEALAKDISQEVLRLGRSIYRALEEEFYAQISAEAVQETLIANGYTYLSDGTPFRIESPVYGR
jgi:hypothetical protein